MSGSPIGYGTRMAARARAVVAVACFVQFVDVVGVTLLIVALAAIQRDLGLGAPALSWAAAVYALVFGSLLVLGGRAADLAGRRVMFVGGNLAVVAGSALCAVAGGAGALIAGRALQGAGAAAAVPAALAAILAAVPDGPGRGRALGWWTLAGAAGGASGFVLGGVVTQAVGWRWLFAGVAAVALAAALLGLTFPAGRRRGGSLDVTGALLLTGSVVVLLLGLQQGPWPVLLLVPIGLWGFAVTERRVREPLVPPELWSVRSFGTGAAVASVLTATTGGAAVVGTLFLQEDLGVTAGGSGAVFLVFSIAVAAVSTVAPAVLRRAGPSAAMALGLAVVALALAGEAFAVAAGSLPLFVAGLGLSGLGLGVASVASTAYGTSEAGEERAGLVGGILNAAAQTGTAVGVAVLLLAAERGRALDLALAALVALAAAASTIRRRGRGADRFSRPGSVRPPSGG
ncbi:MFS transporter [Nucisporomicrobium flavum]|uniref:MFS transporter n=1 Tax=Nucisporomicrobium flavum TaxID=2785915 RepID=UPI003C2F0F5E